MTSNDSSVTWHPGLATHRRFLWGLARLQVGNDAEADDIVQDTLLAAAQGTALFSGAAPLRAWLTGILKHKIIDALRVRSRTRARLVQIDDATDDKDGAFFTDDGNWDTATFIDTVCPQSQAAQRQLLELVEQCLQALAPRSARLLLMREYLGMDSDDIVAQTDITPGNLRVILHRARMQLRACVVLGWGELI